MFKINFEAYSTYRNLILGKTLYDAVKWNGKLLLRLNATGDDNENITEKSLSIDVKEFHGIIFII